MGDTRAQLLHGSRSEGSFRCHQYTQKTPKKYEVKRLKASKTQTVLRCIAMREGLIRQIWQMLPKKDLVEDIKRRRMAAKLARKKVIKKNAKIARGKNSKRNYGKRKCQAPIAKTRFFLIKKHA